MTFDEIATELPNTQRSAAGARTSAAVAPSSERNLNLDELAEKLASIRGTTTIAFTASKGGVGKTTSVVNIAAALARIHAVTQVPGKILVIDADPQTGSVGALGNLESAVDPERTLGALLTDTEHNVRAWDCVAASPWDPDRLHYMISSYATLERAADELPAVHNRTVRLRDALAPIRNAYRWILIDTTPRPREILGQNAWACADYLVVPTNMQHLGMGGIPRLDAALNELHKAQGRSRPQILGYLINMMRAGVPAQVRNEQDFRSHLKSMVFRTVIPENNAVAEAFSFGQSVFAYNPRAAGALAYGHVTMEIISRVSANQ